MNKGRNIRKKNAIRHHRKDWYLYTLYRLFEGKATPEDVTKRWRKLKEVL